MPDPKDRQTIKNLMIVIAIMALVLYSVKMVYESFVWMVRAGW